MNLYIKQRVFTWGDKFSVYDEAGNVRYTVEGEVFTWGKKLHLYDLSGNEVAFIQQKVFSFLPKYYVFQNGFQTAEITKEFVFFRDRYTVHGPDWQVHGDFFSHEYEVVQGARTIVTVSREWFTWGDTYRLSIAPDADTALAIAVVLVIDACIEASNNN